MSYVLDAYDDALHTILKRGVRKHNRTGVDTLAVFGIQSRYRIDDRFPILTRRKVWPKSIFAELLWFISGSTNNQDLQALGSNIWTPWVDPAFEERYGYAPGCLGPIYGFQLRHFGGHYGNGIGGLSHTSTADAAYDCAVKVVGAERAAMAKDRDDPARPNRQIFNVYGIGGHDQLQTMIDTLRTDPGSRRNLFSLWNPAAQGMRLPPCHFVFQVFTHENKLSGMLTQRSCDFPVGVPANIQFYSALTYMLAQQTGFEPYEFIHSTADSHIYVDQIDAVEEYLSRSKPTSPRLSISKAQDMYSYNMDSFQLSEYEPLQPIKMPVAV